MIVKLHQFNAQAGRAHPAAPDGGPDVVHGHGDRVAARLRELVGDEEYEQHYRVEQFGASRMHLEVVCSRGDRRIGHVLEDLYDAGTERGLGHDRHLRHEPVLPWHILNHVHAGAEQELATTLAEWEARS
ncbi:hypothetical protein [Streptomyces griseofuscus]|uniref:hypothetical protein n=1 Tax=Streptomyces griseofuscus TaxID=146922 RepID=UPI000F6541F6|nr:hypothetical protein [Streptomyces griseofuscus]